MKKFVLIIITIFAIPALAIAWRLNKTPNKGGEAKDPLSIPIFFYASTKPNTEGKFPIIEYYNQIAEETDGMVFSENSLLNNYENHIKAIKQVNKGEVIQAFASYKTAEEHINKLPQGVDTILYDLENWEKSFDEGARIEESSKKMGEIVRSKGYNYSGHLGVRLAVRNPKDPKSVENMAKNVDSYSFAAYPCLDQMSLEECIKLYKEVAERARSVNPDVKMVMSVSVEQGISPEKLYDLVAGLEGTYDSLGIFSWPNRTDSEERLKEFVGMIR